MHPKSPFFYNRTLLSSVCRAPSDKKSAVAAQLGIMCQCFSGPIWDFKDASSTKSPLMEAEEPLSWWYGCCKSHHHQIQLRQIHWQHTFCNIAQQSTACLLTSPVFYSLNEGVSLHQGLHLCAAHVCARVCVSRPSVNESVNVLSSAAGC